MNWEFEKSVICPKDKRSLKRYSKYKDYYRIKYDIAKRFNPKSILEIGVRAGYSAYSFLSACPDATYVGIDAENGAHGGKGGPWMWWAKEILSEYQTTFIEADTQELTEIDGEYDFIHIDGDHSTKGLLHDLKICWPVMKGVIVVDDYDYLPRVKKGCDAWAEKDDVEMEYVESLRGEIIFRRSS
ncbi:MAG: O-methyltransferase [Candidatus Kariarchaeaceae archaeon]